MFPLTYDRLLTSLNGLIDAIPVQLPGDENIQRREELRAAIQASLAKTRAGLEGDKNVQTPGALKHDLVAKIDAIHSRFVEAGPPEKPKKSEKRKRSASPEAAPAPSPKKQKTSAVTVSRVLRSTNGISKKKLMPETKTLEKKPRNAPATRKVAPKDTAADRQATEILLELASSKQALPAAAQQMAPAGASLLPGLPTIEQLDVNAPAQQHFLAGVHYALSSLPADPRLAVSSLFASQLLGHVKQELGSMNVRQIAGRTFNEYEAMIGMEMLAAQPREASARKGFWDVV